MAENVKDSSELTEIADPNLIQSSYEVLYVGADPYLKQNRPSSVHRARSESSEEREQRLKMLREKQNDERQRKLEELKAQALAAQQFREMKEQERRRRIEELRVKENDRRQQVGERKKIIYEAERDRCESILKKNQEREARFEMKRRNERGSLVFAFGSSTPRMLEPADTGGSFWGYRRATSTNNILFSAIPLTRRSSERELDGSKKRATSAGGLDRNNSEDIRMPTSMYEVFHWDELSSPVSSGPARSSYFQTFNSSKQDDIGIPTSHSVSSYLGNGETIAAGCASGRVGRRRTDLMPTIPLRDSTSTPVRKPFAKSPGPSRPGSSLSQQSSSSVSSTVNLRPRPVAAPRKPRPASIAVTGVTHDSNRNPIINEYIKKHEVTKPPLPKTRKPSIGKLITDKSITKNVKVSPKLTPKSTPLQSPCTDMPITEIVGSQIIPLSIKSDIPVGVPVLEPKSQIVLQDVKIITMEEKPEVMTKLKSELSEQQPDLIEQKPDLIEQKPDVTEQNSDLTVQKNALIEEKPDLIEQKPELIEQKSEFNEQRPELIRHKSELIEQPPLMTTNEPDYSNTVVDIEKPSLYSEPVGGDQIFDTMDMTASMIAKVRITTEEEAKAALAERRRLAREEAERQAEAEKLLIEQEEERQRQEEEQLRILAEEQRKAEDERLAQAIKEAQKREEEEKIKREEELKQKLEKEEQERKAREENEKKKIEMEERLKQEENEREARRKRVEAIMLRTRAKGNSGNQTKNNGGMNDKNSPTEENKEELISNNPTIESYEKTAMEKEAALFSSSFKNQSTIIPQENSESLKEPQHSNGHQNGVENSENRVRDDNSLIQQNVTNTLLDLSELDPFKNANASLDLSADKITNEDNVNSNNTTDSHGTTDILL